MADEESNPTTLDTDVRVMFTRLDAKLDVALARQGGKLEEHGRIIDDHERRLRAAEKESVSKSDLRSSQTRTLAVISVIACVIGALSAAAAVLIG